MSTILLIGGSGQIGRELARVLPTVGTLYIADRTQCDLRRPQTLIDAVDVVRPTVVINAAAYTAVDKAEDEPALATAVNAGAPGVLAHAARRHGALFVHYSTDYVFDGRKQGAYSESDPVNPLSTYGRTKLAGERAVRDAGGDHLIFRTSWIYAPHGRNFLLTMLHLAKEREQLRVVADQVGAPTTARLVAEATVQVLRQDIARRRLHCFESGLLHLTASGKTSWYGFASALIAAAQIDLPPFKCREIVPITTAEYPLPATRPANSLLDCARLAQRYGMRMPSWDIGMQLCLEELHSGVADRSTMLSRSSRVTQRMLVG